MHISVIWKKILGYPRYYTIPIAVAVVLLVVFGVHMLTGTKAVEATVSGISHVRTSSVASLSSATGPLPVTGKVTSLSQASILAQTSGEIVSLSRSIGDYVGAGGVIGSFENSSQQAGVLQAQGAYEAASAALARASGTSATNSNISSSQAAQNAQNAETGAGTALQSMYAALDDAVHTKADQLFTNARTASAQLVLIVPDSQLTNTIVQERIALEGVLAHAKSISTPGKGDDIDAAIMSMTTDAQTVNAFLTNLIKAVNVTSPSGSVSAATLAGYQASLGAARSATVGAISSLTAAKSAYDASVSGSATATNAAAGGTENDIALATANVKQALGALYAAKAGLEKTIIRSPISGTIVSLPITRGDFVSAFSPVAVVSNPGALYVDVYVTSDDAKTLAVGNKATIGSATPGIITFIAPALDPTTGKIEVKVGIVGDQGALTDGDTETLTLNRIEAQVKPVKNSAADIVIPIVAVKITPTGPVVFTVTASSTLAVHPLTLGSILGDQVVVPSGLTSDMVMVTDARGHTDGEKVIVDTD